MIKLKIKSVTIENFRSIKKTTFVFKDLTTLIGENNTGKTNILKALDWFFSPSARGITEEDFCNKDPRNEIKITVSFDCLTPDKLNSRTKKYLINDSLVVQKTFCYDSEKGKYESKSSGLIREPKKELLKDQHI